MSCSCNYSLHSNRAICHGIANVGFALQDVVRAAVSSSDSFALLVITELRPEMLTKVS